MDFSVILSILAPLDCFDLELLEVLVANLSVDHDVRRLGRLASLGLRGGCLLALYLVVYLLFFAKLLVEPEAYVGKFLTDDHWVFSWFLVLLSFLFALGTRRLFVELQLLFCIPVNGHRATHGLLLSLPELTEASLVTLLQTLEILFVALVDNSLATLLLLLLLLSPIELLLQDPLFLFFVRGGVELPDAIWRKRVLPLLHFAFDKVIVQRCETLLLLLEPDGLLRFLLLAQGEFGDITFDCGMASRPSAHTLHLSLLLDQI